MSFISRSLLLVAALYAAAAAGADRTILVLGDSLSASYGMDMESGWVSLLEARAAAQGYRIHNASVSGETSRGALARLDPLVARIRPDVAIVELGGNDGLRGVPLDELRSNLQQIVRTLVASGSRVLLLPMKLPPNYGPVYTERFEGIYRDLGQEPGVSLGTFMLEGVALKEHLMQEDGIHPRAEAQPVIMEAVWRSLEPMLEGALSAAPDT
jgi:acyl-CoA thioesterase-1